nr:NADH dehydrogenase subunit 4 [Clerus klapperichi]
MLFMMLFMIPLIFIMNYWMMLFLFSLLTLIFMMKVSMNFMFINISNILGYDLLSFLLILLSFWICMLMILASSKLYKNNINSEYFLFVNMILTIILYLVFSSMNLFIFYLFFEFSLIPVLLMIMGWGYQPERIQAGVYLMFYTLFASLPMMISIFYLYNKSLSLEFFYIQKYSFDSIIFYLFMNFVFFIKMPMYLVHLWLPKAHVEAPIAGSMILAGIMLKLGGYGLIRLMYMFMKIGMIINIYFIILSLMGGFFISLICLNQSDLKALVAYSSVSHMALVMSGILTFSYWGVCGSVVMMIAHGLCSSGLFCLCNIVYERTESRSVYLNKGLMNLVPSMSLWWFLLCSSNMAAPPSMNLMGEIMLINSLVFWSPYLMLFLSLISFFSAAYSLYLYSYTQHGKFYSGIYCKLMMTQNEFKLLFLHWFPLNLLILKGEMLFFML